ncbi:GON-4-like protein isoform X1 [Cricetulus griseus]|uniref:GON-4-like protein isoform X1 n=1 Tax=Cricetulus griseus TaxID=10029 RepID=UPI00022F48B7|nr:GON-4-like protein isoform X1 [Cricetulus griseus]
MLPCKKRRATVTESVHQQDSQEGDDLDLESSVKPESVQLKDLASESLSWDQHHESAVCPCVASSHDVENQLSVEDPSLRPKMLTQHGNPPVLEAVDGAIAQEIALPSLESSHSLTVHMDKERLQATASRKGKKIVFPPGLVTREDQGDHPVMEEPPSGEPGEEVMAEGGKLEMHSGGELPFLSSGSQSAKPGAQPRKPFQPDGSAFPQEKPLRTVVHQTEEEKEDGGLFIPMERQENEESDRRKKTKKGTKRKRDGKCQEQGTMAHDLNLDDMLDRTLEDGAKQHNLTAVNVRNILHEVITNEHVVAMMKAAISETEDMPLFEPKMTRSKLKEVVEKGVVIPTWNISPIKTANEIKQPPQFVDIHLEEDDSSDEEYQPDEEEEDETAEESLLESDVESTASSPRGVKRSRLRASSEVAETDEESGMLSEVEKVTTPAVRHISAEVVPMGPPPPPKPKQSRDSAFMEKLNAVDEELASSPVCMDSFQPMEDSLIAFRTRSKMPLKDVPLGQLEAELQAPDITPDMYDPNTADDEDWKVWLGGLLNDDVENEDEADDDDDPEYNFLEDLDEPDTEDFRTDRAVRITKKEVNGLMEELFETFQDEMGFSNMEEDGPEEEERVSESRPNFNTPQTLRFEEPLANLLNERHRTVKELLEQLKMKKSACKSQPEVERLKLQKEIVLQTLILDPAQRSRLQQQMQQHVQLLTQVYLLTTSNPNLSSEASTTRVFLKELGTFAENSIALHQQFNPNFQTLFQPCNWMGAMQLIEDFTHVSVDCSPQKTAKKTASEFPCLPKQVAWILATNKVFMYPELLPICSLKANNPRDKIVFTKAEDNLLALGLKHFEGTEFPKPLISKYLVTCKTAHQLTVRIKNLNQNRAPNNVIKVSVCVCSSSPVPPAEEHLALSPPPLSCHFQVSLHLNPGKMATWPAQSEVPPGNRVVQIPHLIQPTPVLQTLQGFPPVGVSREDCIESPAAALPAMPSGPEARTSFPLSESQSLLPSSSAPKIMLPSLAPSSFVCLSVCAPTLGLKHFEGTEFPKPLISKYLVTCKTAHQLTVRIKNLNQNRAPNNVIKETMEKLTWLASERSMSQEGESEEENSQEENSEPEEEEEEEAEGMEALQKEGDVNDEAVGDAAEKQPSTLASPKTAPQVETSVTPAGETIKAAGRGRSNHRARNKRGSRARASKDTSKLLLLYDEDILDRDPLREQKDLAFAQAYLTRVREALQHVPGKYEDFLQVIYEFESSTQRHTAVDLYKSLQTLLQDWPQLLKDFAAFLLPEQALSCGLFEEQQAFEKSRKFLRQLEICFAENPTHHQKIIKVLQGCADCLPQDISELKTQMWQLLKGHDHLQDEFSIFFDHLRPAASRLGDFEEINWTEEKEYEFDGFEEVILPDVEEEEEPAKVSTASKSKRRKEIGVQNHDKETEWPEVAKDCSCSCHDGGPDSKLKKSKRRNCHCSSKVCDSKSYKSKESLELVGNSPLQEASSMTGNKEVGQDKDVLEEEPLEEQENIAATQSRSGRTTRKGEIPIPGSTVGSALPCSAEVTVVEQPLEGPTLCSPETPRLPPQTGVVFSSVRRNQVGPEIVSCLGTSTILPEKGEDLKAAANSETTVPLPDVSETEKLPGFVEIPASLPSPVSSRTSDTGKRHICGKAGTQSWLLESRVEEAKTIHMMTPICGSSSGVDSSEITPQAVRGVVPEDRGTQGKGPEGALPKVSEATVCANNSKVSSTGEKVVLWTREADRVILTMCQEQGAQPHTFSIISQQLGNKTPLEVSHRFRELMQLFHTACEASSEDEDDATSTSNTDQLSDHGDLLSEEELDE